MDGRAVVSLVMAWGILGRERDCEKDITLGAVFLAGFLAFSLGDALALDVGFFGVVVVLATLEARVTVSSSDASASATRFFGGILACLGCK